MTRRIVLKGRAIANKYYFNDAEMTYDQCIEELNKRKAGDVTKEALYVK